MFASKTPRKTPRKYLPDHFDGDGCVFGDGREHFAPRQHNEPNPILVAFRPIYTPESARWYQERVTAMPGVRVANWGHINHARRVLTRLARLTEGASA